MNLHRTPGHAEWSNVPAAQQNGWQKIAARTHGVVTMSNFFSLVGLASVPYGLWLILSQGRYEVGILVLLLGRLCDLLDGWLADFTHTKSPLGEKIDATFDKISVAATVLALALGGIITWVIVVLLLAPHAIVAGLALIAYFRKQRLHPSPLGKLSMAVAWLTILAFTLLHSYRATLSQINVVILTAILAFGLLFVAVAMSVAATYSYIQEFERLPKRTSKSVGP